MFEQTGLASLHTQPAARLQLTATHSHLLRTSTPPPPQGVRVYRNKESTRLMRYAEEQRAAQQRAAAAQRAAAQQQRPAARHEPQKQRAAARPKR